MPFQVEVGVPSWFRRRTFHEPNSLNKVRRLNRALDYNLLQLDLFYSWILLLQLDLSLTIIRFYCN